MSGKKEKEELKGEKRGEENRAERQNGEEEK